MNSNSETNWKEKYERAYADFLKLKTVVEAQNQEIEELKRAMFAHWMRDTMDNIVDKARSLSKKKSTKSDS